MFPRPSAAAGAAPVAKRAPSEVAGYPVMVRPVAVGGHRLELLGPANFAALIDEPRVAARFAQDEYMPYWADLWPGALMLAAEVASWSRADVEPPTVLELGCGLGLAGLVAAARGWHVILSDYDDDALAFALASAAHNGLPGPRTRFVDWRETYSDLRPDVILAADVLYETRNLVPIADFVRRHLRTSPTSRALVADPNRSTAEAFDGIARHSGLNVRTRASECVDGRGQCVAGRIFELSLKLDAG